MLLSYRKCNLESTIEDLVPSVLSSGIVGDTSGLAFSSQGDYDEGTVHEERRRDACEDGQHVVRNLQCNCDFMNSSLSEDLCFDVHVCESDN